MREDQLVDRLGLLRGLYGLWRDTLERCRIPRPKWAYRLYVRRYHRAFERYAKSCVVAGKAPALITSPLAYSGLPDLTVGMIGGLAAAIALGRVYQNSSFGLDIILGGLINMAGGFSNWAFGESRTSSTPHP